MIAETTLAHISILLAVLGLALALVPARRARRRDRITIRWQERLAANEVRQGEIADQLLIRSEALNALREEIVDGGIPDDKVEAFEQAYGLGRERGLQLADYRDSGVM